MDISVSLKKWMRRTKKNTNKKKKIPLNFNSIGTMSFMRRDAISEEDVATTDLHAAIAFNEYVTVSHLLILPKIDASIPGQDGKTPLQTAIEYGRVEIVKLLLKMPTVSPHGIVDKYNRTPLHIACWKGHEAIVELLLATRPKKEQIEVPLNDAKELNQQHNQNNLSMDVNTNIEAPLKAEMSNITKIGQQPLRKETNIDVNSQE